jgi:hypothetical protein
MCDVLAVWAHMPVIATHSLSVNTPSPKVTEVAHNKKCRIP